ncbi:lipid II:glycine glycyltransferase FemX [Luteococcus sp.]|uniref:lipid II:glycine glycyltransferase FemX n=1 Tax=Luteococcus sp. TaxID=1969402 RepID=UPI00373536A1
MTITVRQITAEQHLAFIEAKAADPNFGTTVSFLQLPAWAKVKPEWAHESLGIFDGSELVGTALALYRSMPKIGRTLAYLPEGPVVDWRRDDIEEILQALAQHAKRKGAFGLRIGPTVIERVWEAGTIKEAIADELVTSLSQVTPDFSDPAHAALAARLRRMGWRTPEDGEGFAAGQPQFNFQLVLIHEDGSQKSTDEVLAGMNQQWRRNIKRAAKAGVDVVRGGREDLAAFHEVYLVTAERDGFTGRPLSYFETMWDALNGEPKGATVEQPHQHDRMRVYLARHEGDVVAATTWIQVGLHTWYSYGASANEKREVRGSNAIQWQMIQDSLEAGAAVYDLRGIVQGVGADDPEIGLIQFKVGTGGRAVAYLGEWDLAINKPLYAAFDLYMNRSRHMARAKALTRNPKRFLGPLKKFVGSAKGAVK